jgi:hypothetical protein
MFSVIDIAALVVFTLLGTAIVVITIVFLFFSFRSRPVRASPNSSLRFNRGSSIFDDIELQIRPSRPEPVYIPSPSILDELPFPHPNLRMTSTFGSAYAISISTTIERTTNTAEEELLE